MSWTKTKLLNELKKWKTVIINPLKKNSENEGEILIELKGLTILRGKGPTNQELQEQIDVLNVKVDKIEVRLDKIEVRLDNLDKKIDEGLNQVNKKIDEGLAQVNQEMAQVNQEMAQVNQEMAQVNKKIDQLADKLSNDIQNLTFAITTGFKKVNERLDRIEATPTMQRELQR